MPEAQLTGPLDHGRTRGLRGAVRRVGGGGRVIPGCRLLPRAANLLNPWCSSPPAATKRTRAPRTRRRRGGVVLCVRWRSQSATPGRATAARVRASATPCADGTMPDRTADERPRGSLHRPYRPRVGTPFLGTGPTVRRGRRPGQRREPAVLHRRLRSRRSPARDHRTRASGTRGRYHQTACARTSPFRPLSRASRVPTRPARCT